MKVFCSVLPEEEKPAPCLQSFETTQAPQRIGISSEWAGTSQPKNFLGVFMNRSKVQNIYQSLYQTGYNISKTQVTL